MYVIDLYKQGLQYRTINNHRSAISEIMNRYRETYRRVIWNLQTVIDFISKEWGRNQEFSDKFLNYKVTMVMALTPASRALGLQYLNLRFM